MVVCLYMIVCQSQELFEIPESKIFWFCWRKKNANHYKNDKIKHSLTLVFIFSNYSLQSSLTVWCSLMLQLCHPPFPILNFTSRLGSLLIIPKHISFNFQAFVHTVSSLTSSCSPLPHFLSALFLIRQIQLINHLL